MLSVPSQRIDGRNVDGSIAYCRVHDLIRDLAIREATNENFVKIFRNPKGVHCRHLGTRRASLQSDHCNEECLKCVGPNNCTLLWFDERRSDFPEQYVKKMVEFRLLRILVIVNVNEIKITGFDRLIHLKYLNIAAVYVYLPDDFSWGCLKNLQTLEIKSNSVIYENDKNNVEMMSLWTIGTLRHVRLHYHPGPPPNADLRNLQTLYGVQISRSWQNNQLPHLNNLQDLRIIDASRSKNWDGLAHLLGTLPHLLNLSIWAHDSIIPKEIVYPRGLPNYENLQTLELLGRWSEDVPLDARLFPPHLLELKINNSALGQDPMSELGKLKGLKKLLLRLTVYKGGEEMICPTGFPVLQTLKLIDLGRIKSFRVMEGVMPKLKHFMSFFVNEDEREIKISMPSHLRHFSN